LPDEAGLLVVTCGWGLAIGAGGTWGTTPDVPADQKSGKVYLAT
jgi:hypothetical protein